MSVGDIESDEKGSGARFNDGKLPMEFIPVQMWLRYWGQKPTLGINDGEIYGVLRDLARFQAGDDDAIHAAITHLGPSAMDAAVRVFDYGAAKYASWNWAKGMQWSVIFGCILRHARAIIEQGEPLDEESGQPHIGHIGCNLIMLAWFVDHYPEGDDRPPVFGGEG